MAARSSRSSIATLALLTSILVLTCQLSPMAGSFIVPYKYPLFKQCNSSWGEDVMEKQTICEVGCLMTSVSMALNHYSILVDGQSANPGTLNKWLRNNGGYVDGDDLDEKDVMKLSERIDYIGAFYGNNSFSSSALQTLLKSGIVTIANVMKGEHFVLVTGWDSSSSQVWAVNGECSDHNLLLNLSVPTVRDVKEKIEQEFQIPKCLQELTLNGRSDFDEQLTLSSLYIPNKSLATVRYSSSAEVEFLTSLMKEFASLKETVANLPPYGILERRSIENCQRQLHTASSAYLYPWASLSVDANRKFIIQEGGITLVLDLLSLLYPKSGGVPSMTTAVKMALAESLLLFVWQFAETTEDCSFILALGAAEVLLKYLNLVSSDSEVKIPKMLYAFVLGCIATYSDIDSFQITSSSNRQALHQLLKPTVKPPVDEVEADIQMSIAATFFYLSHCKESHTLFTSGPVVDDLMRFLDWILQMQVQPLADYLAMDMYVLSITVLRLLVLSPVNGSDPSPTLVLKALAIMRKLVDLISADTICRIVARKVWLWRYMFPFIEMGYGALHEASCVRNGPQSNTDTILCLKVALFSLGVTMNLEENRKLVRAQHLLDYFICLNWHLPRAHDVQRDKYVEGLRLFYSDSPVEVPSLTNMVRAKMAAHWPKLGLKKATTSTVQELAATLT